MIMRFLFFITGLILGIEIMYRFERREYSAFPSISSAIQGGEFKQLGTSSSIVVEKNGVSLVGRDRDNIDKWKIMIGAKK